MTGSSNRQISPLEPLIAPIVFALIVLIACGTTLFSATKVLAAPGTDLPMQFIAWRQFGFTELAHGNLAL